MQDSDLEKSYLALIEYLLLSKHRVTAHGSKFDLTAMQAVTLCLLDQPRPMNSFKKIFNCDASNVTGLVDGLEQKKMVARIEDPEDRRLKLVKPLPKGEKVRRQLLSQLAHDGDTLTKKLSPAETKTFIKLVKKMTS